MRCKGCNILQTRHQLWSTVRLPYYNLTAPPSRGYSPYSIWWRIWQPFLSCHDNRPYPVMLQITKFNYVCHWLVVSRWFSPGTPYSFTNNNENQEITEIMFQVAINTSNHVVLNSRGRQKCWQIHKYHTILIEYNESTPTHIIKSYTFNLLRMTSLWNKCHPVHSKPKDWKAK